MSYKDRLQPYQEIVDAKKQSQTDDKIKLKEVETEAFQSHLDTVSQLGIQKVLEDIKNELWERGSITIDQTSEKTDGLGDKPRHIKTKITLSEEWPTKREVSNSSEIGNDSTSIIDGSRGIFISVTLSSLIHYGEFSFLGRGYQPISEIDLQVDRSRINSDTYETKEPLRINLDERPMDRLSDYVSLKIVTASEELKKRFEFPLEIQARKDKDKIYGLYAEI